MDTTFSDRPVWAGIALRLPAPAEPSGFVLLTMQMVPFDALFDIRTEEAAISYGATTRVRPLARTLTVKLEGALVGSDHWDQWRPEDYRGPAGALDGRRALSGGGGLALPRG